MKVKQILTMLALVAIIASTLSACGGLGGGGRSGDSNAGAITLQFDGIEKQEGSYLLKRKSADGSVVELLQTDSPLQIDLNQGLNYVEQSKTMNLPGAIDQECQSLLNNGFVLIKTIDYVEKHSAGSLFFAKPAITDAAKEGEAEKRFITVEVIYGMKGPKPQQAQ